MVAYALLSRAALFGLCFVAASRFPDRGLGLRSGSTTAILGWQLTWAAVTIALTALASFVAQRTVKEISERPTGQM